MTATTQAAPLYGFTESGSRAHFVADPSARTALCGLLLDYIPLNQAGNAVRCRRCTTAADQSPHLVVSGPLKEPTDEQVGACSHCGGEAPVNDLGMVIPHGVVRIRGGEQVRTAEPCPGGGHAPEALEGHSPIDKTTLESA